MLFAFRVKEFHRVSSCVAAWLIVLLCCIALSSVARAQQTTPVDRQVTNPITDTPNVNPLEQNQPIVRPRRVTAPDPNTSVAELASTEELEVDADRSSVTGAEGARVVVYEGNVDARIGVYRLQTDRLTVYEVENRVVAEGNVVFDQQPGQRITGSRAEFNYRTKTGFFIDSTGFTNQTQDGTVLNFTADRVEKISASQIVAYNAEVTACDEEVPKWSFRSKRAELTLNDRVRLKRPSFRVKGFPLIYLPYASVSIKQRDRASGFLTPTFSASGAKGFRLSNAYYQTLGRSADVTLRNDIYSKRGLGIGADVRTRANSRSFLNFGFFTVKDRIFGEKVSPTVPDQGGSSFYVDGVQYFPNGFLAAADVNITSSLAFRQIFSDGVQQAVSPEERSQVFVNRNFRDYSFNLLARSQVTSLPEVRIRTRQLPSISFEKRPGIIERFGLSKRIPVYFSFDGTLEGVSRKETFDTAPLAVSTLTTNGEVTNALVTPSIVQRFDFRPRFSIPVSLDGWTLTTTGTLRATYYSNSLTDAAPGAPLSRIVTNRDLVRAYTTLEIEARPPALARNFRHNDGAFRFRHTIEPYLIYRKTTGINNFERIIRFDETDTVADTNEFEFGVTNRFWTRRATERVGFVDAKTANDASTTTANASNTASDGATTSGGDGSSNGLTPRAQPYEVLSVTLRAKYFFDPYFGGALVPGRRNQFSPINTFSGFTYGGVPRRFSPANLEVRYRPRSQLFADARFDFDVRSDGGLRDLAISFGLDRRLIQAFQTFYFTRAINLAPSLRQFADPRGNEPGTLQGSQWSPQIFVGNRERGFFGGVSFFFDFQNRPETGGSSLRSSTTTVGYAFDCCAIVLQNYTYDIGLRKENRLAFSFRLNGIGAFGTEQIGQRFR